MRGIRWGRVFAAGFVTMVSPSVPSFAATLAHTHSHGGESSICRDLRKDASFRLKWASLDNVRAITGGASQDDVRADLDSVRQNLDQMRDNHCAPFQHVISEVAYFQKAIDCTAAEGRALKDNPTVQSSTLPECNVDNW